MSDPKASEELASAQAEVESLRARIAELERDRDKIRYANAYRWIDPSGEYTFWRAQKCNECGRQSSFSPGASVSHLAGCWVRSWEKAQAGKEGSSV
jgi:hypothetical protein